MEEPGAMSSGGGERRSVGVGVTDATAAAAAAAAVAVVGPAERGKKGARAAHEARIRAMQRTRLSGARRQKWLRFHVLSNVHRVSHWQEGVSGTGLLSSTSSSASTVAGASAGTASAATTTTTSTTATASTTTSGSHAGGSDVWRDELVAACISCGHVSLLEAMPTEHQRGGKRWPESLFVTRAILLAAALGHGKVIRAVFDRYGWRHSAQQDQEQAPEQEQEQAQGKGKEFRHKEEPVEETLVAPPPLPPPSSSSSSSNNNNANSSMRLWEVFPGTDFVSVGGLTDLQRTCLLGDADFARHLAGMPEGFGSGGSGRCAPEVDDPQSFLPCLLLAVIRGEAACVAYMLEIAAAKGWADMVNAVTRLESLTHKQHPVDLLGLAAAFGHVEVVKLLLEQNNARVDGLLGDTLSQLTPLLACAALAPRAVRTTRRHLQTARILLRHGADVHGCCSRDPNLISPLAAACRAADEDLALLILDAASPSQRFEMSVQRFAGGDVTTFMFACAHGLDSVVASMVASIDVPSTVQQVLEIESSGPERFRATRPYVLTDCRCTALMLASEKGHTRLATMLVEDYGCTPTSAALRVAATHGRAEIVSLLAQHGVTACPAALEGAARCTRHASALATVRVLLHETRREPMNSRDANGNAVDDSLRLLGRASLSVALIAACHTDNVDLVDMLLEHGAEPVTASRPGIWTPPALMIALRHGNRHIARKLADALDQCMQGRTPFHEPFSQQMAAYIGMGTVCHLTVTPFTAACHTGDPKLVQILLNRSSIRSDPQSNVDAVPLAASFGSLSGFRTRADADGVAVLHLLKENGYSLQHECALSAAVAAGHGDVVHLLLQEGNQAAVVDIENAMPPLHAIAGTDARMVQPALIHMLVDHGAPVDAVDARGRTPLFVAVQGKNLLAVDALLQLGASPNVRDARDVHILAAAVHDPGFVPILRRLLDADPDLSRIFPRYPSLETTQLYPCLEAHEILAAHMAATHSTLRSWGGGGGGARARGVGRPLSSLSSSESGHGSGSGSDSDGNDGVDGSGDASPLAAFGHTSHSTAAAVALPSPPTTTLTTTTAGDSTTTPPPSSPDIGDAEDGGSSCVIS